MRIPPTYVYIAVASVLLLHAWPSLGEGPDASSASAAAEPGNAPAEGSDGGDSSAAHEEGPVLLVSDTQPIIPATAGSEASATEERPSAAERIARLETSLDTNRKRLSELEANLSAPDSEFAKAEARFRDLDGQRTTLQQRISELEKSGPQEELAELRVEAESLQKQWTLAKERFDLAIGERKAMQESVLTLRRKLEGDRASVLKLKDTAEPQRLDAPQGESRPPAQSMPRSASEPSSQIAPAEAAPSSPEPQAATGAAGTPPAPVTEPNQSGAPAAAVEATPQLSEKIAKELAVASVAAEESHAAAKVAEDETRTITDQIDILQQDIRLQRQLRDTARKTADNSEKTLDGLNEELCRKLIAGENVHDIGQHIKEATARLHDNLIKTRKISTRLDELQSQLAQLQSEQLAAANILAEKRQIAQRAQAVVERLKNPFTVRNILQWLIDHGPRIVTILVALALFMWLSRVCESRLVELTAKRGRRGSREERENRAKTLLGVFRNVANIVIVAGGVMMILDEVGVPVAPIIGGAAVFGLAVAFGAQSLIKDYFVGFMVLLEQQYLVNDVIEIGAIKGQVERISLRITVLRDLDGRVHFIPHNQINTVTNMTHGWSRAVFEIGVAYKENVDRVIEVLTSLAEDLRRDEAFTLLILGSPVMLGVDSLGNSAVVIKFYIQTRPLHQWTVKREMLRRIKNEFDRLGIEIPFPHLTIYRGAARSEGQADQEQSGHWPNRDVA